VAEAIPNNVQLINLLGQVPDSFRQRLCLICCNYRTRHLAGCRGAKKLQVILSIYFSQKWYQRHFADALQIKAGNPYRKGWISTVDLLVLTSTD